MCVTEGWMCVTEEGCVLLMDEYVTEGGCVLLREECVLLGEDVCY